MATIIDTLRSFLPKNTLLPGVGGTYVIGILGLVSGLSFLLTGGLTPNIERDPENPQFVEIEEPGDPIAAANLQMQNIGIKPTATPTPSPTITPTPAPLTPTATPTPTTVPQVCYDDAAVAILVDTSGSMAGQAGNGETRMDVLKRALTGFRSNFTPQTEVGLFGYSTDAETLVPFGTYGQNQAQIAQQINGLRPNQFGSATNTRDGLQLVYNNLVPEVAQNPGRRYNVIFFTDGVPENSDCEFVDSVEEYHGNNGDINAPICSPNFSSHPQHPGPISSQIKSLGARIFTVALYKQPPYSPPIQNSIETIMRNVASNPDETYYLGLPTAAGLENAYNQISQRICS